MPMMSVTGSGVAQAQEVIKQEIVKDDEGNEKELVDIEKIDLDDLLKLDINTPKIGSPGSYGVRLESYGYSIKVHGFLTSSFYDFGKEDKYPKANRDINFFDIHYFNLMFSANIKDRVFPEIHIEREHAEEFRLRTAQVDIKLHDLFTIRTGLFLVPFGVYNEYFLPEYMNKVPRRPYVLTNAYIIPCTWSEVGLQVRGFHSFENGMKINYAVYAVNGLEQQGKDADGNVIYADGGSIRSMRGNHRDKFDSNKAMGARLGFSPLKGLELGTSVYSGAYTIDGEQDLVMIGCDVNFSLDALTLRGEYVQAHQDTTGRDLTKQGYWVMAAYKCTDFLEPALRFDQIMMDGADKDDLRRLTMGINIYPFPKMIPQLLGRVAYGVTWNKGSDNLDDNILGFQLSIGF